MQRSVSRYSLWILALLLFITTSSLASAEAPEDKAVSEEVAPKTATTCATGAPDVVWSIGAQSDCTADCWDGSSVTCDQGTSCSATDSACTAEQGYCWDNSGGYQYCPPCPCPEPTCDQLHGQSCKTGTTCYGWPPSCQTYSCNCWNGTLVCP